MVVANSSSREMAYDGTDFGKDNRFQLDQRFDDDSFHRQQKKTKTLQNAERKQGKNHFENKVIVRYDPTLPEHKKFELKLGRDKKPIQSSSSSSKKSEKRKKKKEKLSRVEAAPEPVSEQTFVKISEDLKGYFQKKEKSNEGFSILKLLNRNDADVEDDSECEEPPSKRNKEAEPSPPVDDSDETKPEILNIERLDLKEGTKTAYRADEEDCTTAGRRSHLDVRKGKIFDPENGVWYDTLFLREGDIRLEEGIKWLNTRPVMPENWAKFKKEIYYDALHKREKSLKRLNSLKNPHQQRREHQLNKARKYIHKSIQIKRRK